LRNILLEALHVDDLTSSHDFEKEAFEFYSSCKAHFAKASFNMRKFESNSLELENTVKDNFDGEKEVISGDMTKVLGITWNKKHDLFVFNFKSLLAKAKFDSPTKRNVIQFASSIFDPLGLINPLVVKFKLLFQQICARNLDWDTLIPDDLLFIWQNLLTDLKEVIEIRFLRPYVYTTATDKVIARELHGFCDASQDAYGCCVYLRTTFASGTSTTSLVASKSRVSPMKKKTIPKLELLGAQLLSRLLNQVKTDLQHTLSIDNIFAWTDSTVVYCWLRNENKLYKQFVQARVLEIRENKHIIWKLIETAQLMIFLEVFTYHKLSIMTGG